MYRFSYSECSPMSYIYRQQIYHAWLVAWITYIICISYNLRGLRGKWRCQQSRLSNSVQTWPSLQKAVDMWGSGLFSKDVDISLLKKSLLVFNSLYGQDVPSHKELAFKNWPEFFRFAGRNRPVWIVWPYYAFAAKEFITLCGACTSVVIFLLGNVLFPASKLCNFKYDRIVSEIPVFFPSGLQYVTLDGSNTPV